MTIDTLRNALLNIEIDPEKRREIIEKVESYALEEKAERANSKTKRSKKQHVVVLKCGEQDLSKLEIVASVWEIREDVDPAMLFDKIRAATVDNNLAARRANNRLFKFTDILERLKPKWLKNHELKRVNKEWARVLTLGDDSNFVSENPVEDND